MAGQPDWDFLAPPPDMELDNDLFGGVSAAPGAKFGEDALKRVEAMLNGMGDTGEEPVEEDSWLGLGGGEGPFGRVSYGALSTYGGTPMRAESGGQRYPYASPLNERVALHPMRVMQDDEDYLMSDAEPAASDISGGDNDNAYQSTLQPAIDFGGQSPQTFGARVKVQLAVGVARRVFSEEVLVRPVNAQADTVAALRDRVVQKLSNAAMINAVRTAGPLRLFMDGVALPDQQYVGVAGIGATTTAALVVRPQALGPPPVRGEEEEGTLVTHGERERDQHKDKAVLAEDKPYTVLVEADLRRLRPEETAFHRQEDAAGSAAAATDVIEKHCEALREAGKQLEERLRMHAAAGAFGADAVAAARRAAERRAWLRAERDTWDLVSAADAQRTEDAALAAALTQDSDSDSPPPPLGVGASDAAVVAHLTRTTRELRWLSAARAWAQCCSARRSSEDDGGGGGGAALPPEQRGAFTAWPQTERRLRSGRRTAATGEGVAGLEPDAPLLRVSGGFRVLALDGSDQRDEEDLLRGVWALARAGDRAGAVRLCSRWRCRWRAASLSGGEMRPQDGAADPEAVVHVPFSNPNRALWRDMCLKLAVTLQNGAVSGGPTSEAVEYESTLYAILGGDYDAALASPLNRDWEGQLWCRACAAVDAAEEAAIAQHRSAQAAESALYAGVDALPRQRAVAARLARFAEPLRTVLSRAAEWSAAAAAAAAGAAAEAAPPGPLVALRRLQEALLLGNAELARVIVEVVTPAVKLAGERGSGRRGAGAGAAPELLRFAAHFVLHARRLFPGVFDEGEALAEWDGDGGGEQGLRARAWQCSQELLCAYIEHLSRQPGDEALIALYASRVEPEELRRATYASFLRRVTDDGARAVCYDEGTKYFASELPAMLRQVVRETRLSEPLPPPADGEDVSSGDMVKMNTLRWLQVSEKHDLAAVEEACALIRQFVLQPYGAGVTAADSSAPPEHAGDDRRMAAVERLLSSGEFMAPADELDDSLLQLTDAGEMQERIAAEEARREYSKYIAITLSSSTIIAQPCRPNAAAAVRCWHKLVDAHVAFRQWQMAMAAVNLNRDDEDLLIAASDAASAAQDRLLAVLLYPGGWLAPVSPTPPAGTEAAARAAELAAARAACVPRCASDLWTVCHKTGVGMREAGWVARGDGAGALSAERWLDAAKDVSATVADELAGLEGLFSGAQVRALLRGVHASSMELLRCQEQALNPLH
ncbi:hypothetical protein JKP88DRAFT_261528 [Tribonema minus]|uniref:Nuclear pore complex protein n=1 Tax=Tribonema minus TaxID=303371 RepID=A0A835YJH7_9STRA|nr:hypothetical protein JKP88DRAFT_261528 [Tribonema minus]